MTPSVARAQKERIEWVDAGKGLSILLVVVYHATNWMRSAGFEVAQLDVFHRMLSDLRMPVFFLLSGLFAAKSIRSPWRNLWENKLALFIWVYLLWSILELPAKWLAMAQLTEKIEDGFWISQMLVVAAIPFRASGAIWFIWTLAIFFLAAKLTSSWPLWVQLGLASFTALGVRLVPYEAAAPVWALTGGGLQGCLLFYIFFLTGCYFRHRLVLIVSRMGRLQGSGLVLAWAILWCALEFFALQDNGVVAFLMAFIGCAAGLGAAVLLSRSAWVRWVGARTLPVYVMHSSILIIVVTALSYLPTTSNQLLGIILTLATSGVAVAVALLAHSRRSLGYEWLFQVPVWAVYRIRTCTRHGATGEARNH